MPVGDVLPELSVLVSAVALLLAASFMRERDQWLAAPGALIGLTVAAAFCIAQLGEAPRLTFSGVWALDGASIWARVIILATAALSVLLTPEWLRSDRRHGEYYAILLLATLGAMLLAGAADLMQLIMAVLLSSVTGYTLAAYHRAWPLSVEAGMKYFLVGALANTLLVLGVTLMFGLFATTDYGELAARTNDSPQWMTLVAFSLVVVGVAFKLAAVPAHTWMPDVAEGAPPPAAAFLTIAPKVGAAIALARFVDLFPQHDIAWRAVVATIAVATMTIGNLGALAQNDVRRMLGWSSVSQSGYALMAVAVLGLDPYALPALLFFLASYAVANLAAFGVVTQLRGRTNLADYRGLATAHPLLAAALILSFLSLVGIPPLAGFVGKLALFVTTIESGYAWLAVVALVNTVVSLVYYLRVLAPVYFAEPARPMHTLGYWAATSVFLCALFTIALGGLADPLWRMLSQATILP